MYSCQNLRRLQCIRHQRSHCCHSSLTNSCTCRWISTTRRGEMSQIASGNEPLASRFVVFVVSSTLAKWRLVVANEAVLCLTWFLYPCFQELLCLLQRRCQLHSSKSCNCPGLPPGPSNMQVDQQGQVAALMVKVLIQPSTKASPACTCDGREATPFTASWHSFCL